VKEPLPIVGSQFVVGRTQKRFDGIHRKLASLGIATLPTRRMSHDEVILESRTLLVQPHAHDLVAKLRLPDFESKLRQGRTDLRIFCCKINKLQQFRARAALSTIRRAVVVFPVSYGLLYRIVRSLGRVKG